jgi:hypothetical protein
LLVITILTYDLALVAVDGVDLTVRCCYIFELNWLIDKTKSTLDFICFIPEYLKHTNSPECLLATGEYVHSEEEEEEEKTQMMNYVFCHFR